MARTEQYDSIGNTDGCKMSNGACLDAKSRMHLGCTWGCTTLYMAAVGGKIIATITCTDLGSESALVTIIATTETQHYGSTSMDVIGDYGMHSTLKERINATHAMQSDVAFWATS